MNLRILRCFIYSFKYHNIFCEYFISSLHHVHSVNSFQFFINVEFSIFPFYLFYIYFDIDYYCMSIYMKIIFSRY